MWLMSIPMAITSGQISAIRRSVRKGQTGEALKRAAMLATAGATGTYLTMLAAQDPEEAAMLGAMATGQYVSAMGAQALNGFDYEPEDEYANVEMASLENDWNGDARFGKLLNRIKITGDLARKSMWQPRFLDARYASDAELAVAKRRSLPKLPGDEWTQMMLPAVDALGNTVGNAYNDIKLAGTAMQGGRKGDAFRMLAGIPFPLVREGTGKLRANLRGDAARFKMQDSTEINKKNAPLMGTSAAKFITSGIQTELDKLPIQK